MVLGRGRFDAGISVHLGGGRVDAAGGNPLIVGKRRTCRCRRPTGARIVDRREREAREIAALNPSVANGAESPAEFAGARALPIGEEEQLVLLDRTAEGVAALIEDVLRGWFGSPVQE